MTAYDRNLCKILLRARNCYNSLNEQEEIGQLNTGTLLFSKGTTIERIASFYWFYSKMISRSTICVSTIPIKASKSIININWAPLKTLPPRTIWSKGRLFCFSENLSYVLLWSGNRLREKLMSSKREVIGQKRNIYKIVFLNPCLVL